MWNELYINMYFASGHELVLCDSSYVYGLGVKLH
jgi:hypothetical protein